MTVLITIHTILYWDVLVLPSHKICKNFYKEFQAIVSKVKTVTECQKPIMTIIRLTLTYKLNISLKLSLQVSLNSISQTEVFYEKSTYYKTATDLHKKQL